MQACASQRDFNYYVAQLERKANVDDVNESLQQKANKTTVSNALQRKANKQDTDSTMESKADVSDIEKLVGVIETKVNAADLDLAIQNIRRELAPLASLQHLESNMGAKKADQTDLEHLL